MLCLQTLGGGNSFKFSFTPEDTAGRRDLRDLLIMSIDPPGCVDIDDALSLIDGTLLDLQGRELVAASEVSDLLLDLRMLLARQPVEVAAAT